MSAPASTLASLAGLAVLTALWAVATTRLPRTSVPSHLHLPHLAASAYFTASQLRRAHGYAGA